MADIPTSLTDSEIAELTHVFDGGMNSRILSSQLLGEHCPSKLTFLNQCPISNTYRYIHWYSRCYNVEHL